LREGGNLRNLGTGGEEFGDRRGFTKIPYEKVVVVIF